MEMMSVVMGVLKWSRPWRLAYDSITASSCATFFVSGLKHSGPQRTVTSGSVDQSVSRMMS
jgi:hypothetical protein